MKTQVTLSAQPRTILGKKVSSLRAAKIVPANIYGEAGSKAVQVAEKVLLPVLAEAGETSLVSLQVEGEKKTRSILITAVARHPVTGQVLHADFQEVSLTEKIDADIPLHFIGESPAVKTGMVFLRLRDEIPVEALPADLPEGFEVDISSLVDVGNDITVALIKHDSSKVSIKLDPTEVIATIQAPREEKVEELPIETVTTVQKTPEELAAEEAAKKAEGGKAEGGKAEAKEKSDDKAKPAAK